MEALGAKDYRKECRWGAKCYQKNPEHKAKFKHSERERAERDKENQENMKQRPEGKEEEEKPEKKRALSQDESGDEVDAKKARHQLSESETGDSSQGEEAKKEEEEAKEEEEEVYSDMVPALSASVPREAVEALGLAMPSDFYSMWEFAKSVDQEKPLRCLATVGLKLCGAFELLAGTVPARAPASLGLHLAHHRYYYDTPELQTLVCEETFKTGFHLGYFRDSPGGLPALVVSSVETAGPRLHSLGDNLFGGLYQHLSDSLGAGDPFLRTRAAGLMERLKLWTNRCSMEGDGSLCLDRKTPGMKNRDRQKVAAGAHGAGIIVPYNKDTEVGYREVPETPANLKKMLTKVVEAETEEEKDKAMDAVQELVTFVQFANDEGDPGMGLELGQALLCHGGAALQPMVQHLLGVAYSLLDREQYGKVLAAHLASRSKGKEPDSFRRWREAVE